MLLVMHYNSSCAKASKGVKCNCETCNTLLHGVRTLDLSSRIEEIDGRISISEKCDRENRNGDEIIKECIKVHYSVVLEEYLPTSRKNTDSKLSSIVEGRYKKIQDKLNKECSEFEKDPDGYIANNCLDLVSGQMVKQGAEFTLDQLLPEINEREDAKKYVKLILEHDHLFCVICVAALKVVNKVSEASANFASEVANEMVELVDFSRELSEMTKTVVKAVLRTILSKAFSAVSEKMILSIFPPPFNDKRTIRIVGFIACPNIEDHSDVVEYCAKPLLKEKICEKLTPIIREQLKNHYNQVTKKGAQIL